MKKLHELDITRIKIDVSSLYSIGIDSVMKRECCIFFVEQYISSRKPGLFKIIVKNMKLIENTR